MEKIDGNAIFISYVKKNLPKNLFEVDISNFLNSFDGNEQIESLYVVTDFARELLDLEAEYFYLRKQMNVRPFHVSLAHRLRNYKDCRVLSDADENLARYLNEIAEDKKVSNWNNQKTIWDMRKYLDEVQNEINDFMEAENKLEKENANDRTDDESIIHRLDVLVKINVVLEKHELIIQAVKQYSFPFVFDFVSEEGIVLPSDLQSNDLDALKQKAIVQIEGVKDTQ